MDAETARQIMDIQEQALEDAQFQRLLDEYTIYHPRFLALLKTLSQEQQDVIMDFLGVGAAMHLRLLELAVRL